MWEMSKQNNGHSIITLAYQSAVILELTMRMENFSIRAKTRRSRKKKTYTINHPNHMPVNFGVCMWQHVSKLAEGPKKDMRSDKTKMLPTSSRDFAPRYVKQLRAKNKCIWLEYCSFAHTKPTTRTDFIRNHWLCAETWGLLWNRELYKIIT